MSANNRRKRSSTDVVKKIRNLFKIQEKPLNAYFITSYDQHSNDHNVHRRDRRLEFITNVSGGSGNAIISDAEALLWVDHRASESAKYEIIEPFRLMISGNPDVLSESDWLIKSLPYGGAVGACGRYVPTTLWLALAAKLEMYDICLINVKECLIEEVWLDRPVAQASAIFPYPYHYSGKSALTKLDNARFEMANQNVDLLVVTEMDEIAWILNLRGSGLEYSPLFFAFLIIEQSHLHIFVDDLNEEVTRHLFSEGVRMCDYDYTTFYDCLCEMASCTGHRRIWISDRANYQVYSSIPKRKVLIKTSPIAMEKCIKNDEEAHGMIEAHVYDGYALCKFFCWLNKAVKKRSTAPTEISASEMLEQIKRQNSDYLGPSCRTISAAGANSSVVRYRPQPSSNQVISANDIYLCDSGSHYMSGTTNVTRTYCFGKPTEFQKECYTRVLKGLINLSTTVFPVHTKGSLLDALPRQALWKAGLDYNHGTGHGVGAYLNSIEGPIGISRRRTDDIGLLPNMFVTIAPACYKENEFGVRVGDVQHLIMSNASPQSENKFLMFENITLVPYQATMLVPSLLSSKEIDYINSYHMKIRNILAPVYKTENSMDEFKWLLKMTESLVH